MKRVFTLVIWVVTITAGYGYAQSLSNGENFTIITKNGKKGLQDSNGKMAIPAKYENLGWTNHATTPLDGVIGFQQNGLWGLISTSNRIVLKANYCSITKNESFNYVIATKSNNCSEKQFFGVLNVKGKEVIPFIFDVIVEVGDALIVARSVNGKSKYGLQNYDSEEILPFKYENIYPISTKLLVAQISPNYMQLFDLDNHTISHDGLSNIELTERGNFKLYRNLKCGLIDDQNTILAPIEFKDLKWIGSELKGLRYNNWTIYNGENEPINGFEADKVIIVQDKAKVVISNNQLLIDKKGKVVTPQFREILDMQGNHVVFKDEQGYGAYDATNELYIGRNFDSLRLEGEFYYLMNRSNDIESWDIIDTLQTKRNKYSYESVKRHHNRLFAVKRNGLWGFIGRNGFEVIPCEFDSVGEFVVNDVVVRKGDKEGIMSVNGKWLVQPRNEKIELLNHIYFLSRGEGITTFENVNGQLIYSTINKIEFKNGLLWEYKNDGSIIKIDLKGKLLIAKFDITGTDYEEIKFMFDDWVAVKLNGKYGFFDTKLGIIRISTRYEDVGQFNLRNRLIPVKILGKWGAVNKNEKLVIQPNYDSIYSFVDDVAITKLNNYYGLINDKGEILLDNKFEQLTKLDNGRYLSKLNGKFGLINQNGKVIITHKYDGLEDTSNGYVIVRLGNKFGLTTLNGVNTIPLIYDVILYNNATNHYLVEEKKSWEFIYSH